MGVAALAYIHIIRGEDCICGDVRYHKKQDSLNQKTKKTYLTVYAIELTDIDALVRDEKKTIRYGCLDKYSPYA